MSRTYKDKKEEYNGKKTWRSKIRIGKKVKEEKKQKRKAFKDIEITNGNVLDKMMADPWDYD